MAVGGLTDLVDAMFTKNVYTYIVKLRELGAHGHDNSPGLSFLIKRGSK